MSDIQALGNNVLVTAQADGVDGPADFMSQYPGR